MTTRRVRIPGVSAGAERNIAQLVVELDDRLRALERKSGRAGVIEQDTAAAPGEFLNIEAPPTGLTVILPQATPALRNARVTLNARNANPVRVTSILGLVNGAAFVINDSAGTFEAVCNGLDGWTLPGYITPAGSTPTWDEVLTAGNTTGANNPTIDSGQRIIFAGTGASPSGGDIDAAGDLTLDSVGDMHLHSHGALHVGHSGDTSLVHVEADTQIDITTAGDILEQAGTTWDAIAGGDASIASTGGNVELSAAGFFQVLTDTTLRFKITFDGAWELNATPGTAGQYLRSAGAGSSPVWASIAYSELPSIAGLSVLGRSGSTSGTPAAITAATARHVIRANDALTGIEWGYPIAVRSNTGTAFDTYRLDFINGTHTTSGVGGTATNALVSFSVDVASLLAAIDSTSIVVASSTLQRAAITGAISVAQNANASLFAGIRVNGSATTDRTNLNFLSGDSIVASGTDDSGSDEIELKFDYAGTTSQVTLSSITGNQGTIDISSLKCGGAVVVASPTGDWQIEGFNASGKDPGFWFTFTAGSGGFAGRLLEEDTTATSTNRIRNANGTDNTGHGLNGIIFYNSSRWRAVMSHKEAANSELVLSNPSGNQGTIDISTLECGGIVRATTASSAWSIEGFTSKDPGFWFFFDYAEDSSDECIIFHEDGTATDANRIQCPNDEDFSGTPLRGIVFRTNTGNRWAFLPQSAPNKIGQGSSVVSVSDGDTGAVTIASGSSTVSISSGPAADIDMSGANVDVDTTNMTLLPVPRSDGGVLGGNIDGWGPVFCVYRDVTSSGSTSAGDTSFFNAAAPFAFTVLGVGIHVTTGQAASTVTMRSATGGGGTALSSALDTATSGTVRYSVNFTGTARVALGGSLVARWSNRTTVGRIWAVCMRDP